MFGKNPIRSVVKGSGDELDVQDIFLTIQGEGPFVGTPAVFIRLGGCNLACEFCDTEFESFKNVKLDYIIDRVKVLSQHAVKLVVITGGEPFRQPIEKLCDSLVQNDYKVQIETNGTLYRDINENVYIICSPKASKNGYGNIRADLLSRINAVKFLVSKFHEHYSQIPQLDYTGDIYVQPMDEYDPSKNAVNIEYAMEICKNKGYILSLQIHKYLGIE